MFIQIINLISLTTGKTACEGERFCLSGTNSLKTGSAGSGSLNETITMTVLSNANGWAAMGFGLEMSNAIIITGWVNSTNGYTITTMTTGKKKKIPDVSPAQIAYPVDLVRDKPSWAKLAFSFTIKKDNPLHTLVTDDNYIWVTL